MSLLVDIPVIVGYIGIQKNDGGRVLWTIGRLLRRIQVGNSSCCDVSCVCNYYIAIVCWPCLGRQGYCV
jgi:hypothetical protein